MKQEQQQERQTNRKNFEDVGVLEQSRLRQSGDLLLELGLIFAESFMAISPSR
jgi:hypothetical protein